MNMWKDIFFTENGITYDYRGLYQVSTDGKIKSNDRIILEKSGRNHFIKGRMLKLQKNKDGYNTVILSKNSKIKKFIVARIVAHMFCDGYFDGAEVDHVIPIKNNGTDKYTNLRWVTHKENIQNEITKKNKSNSRKGKKHPLYNKKGKENPNYEKYRRKIVQLDEDFKLIKKWNGAIEIVREREINYGNLIQCCRGKRRTCKEYIWMYEENYSLIDKLNEYYKFDNKEGEK